MSGTKYLSGQIMEACERNPRLAFFIIPLGALLIWWGGSDSKRYQSMRGNPTQQLHVTSVEDAPNSKGFSVPHVFGKTPNGEVSFVVSFKEARQIEAGQNIEIVETGESDIPYMTRQSLDEQLEDIFFTVAGQPFNFISLLGAVIVLGALGWGLFGKAKAADSTPAPQTT